MHNSQLAQLLQQRTLKRLSPLLAALLLAGCASPNGLNTRGTLLQGSDLQAQHKLQDLTPAPWPDQQWWSVFQDPKLNDLIAEALQNNPDMAAAQARVDEANAAVMAANADRTVNVDGEAGVTRSRMSRSDDPMGLGDRYGTLRQLGLNAGYQFDLWGGNKAAWEAALNQARAAEVEQQAAKLQIASNVALAYNTLALAYSQQDVAARELKRTQAMLTLSKRRLAAGLDSDYQLRQTQSLEAAAEASLTASQQQVESARIRLAVLLGKGPDRADSLPQPALIAPATLHLPANIPAQLAGRRPDLVAALWQTEAAAQQINVSKARFYPNLNLNAAIGVKSVIGDALFGSPSRFFNIGPALTLPIFEGGRLKGGLAQSNAQYDAAVAQYNQTLISALGDIADLIAQARSLDTQIAQQQRARDIALSSYELAMQRYRSGIGNYLDALSVQQQLLQSDQRLASLQADRIGAGVQLLTALGGGFEAQLPTQETDNAPDSTVSAATPTAQP